MFLLIAAFAAGTALGWLTCATIGVLVGAAAVGVVAGVAGVKLMETKTVYHEAAAPVDLWRNEKKSPPCVCVGMFHCIVRYLEFLLIVM